ncbi:carbon-nitrogen hydrolase family protein [Flavilitoribacter nigricans]|uniref:Nitrilase n=1 Tax=Flavilitoribacter nigricans (strain ATCC 23147 / DSM 23189 / NBRC 102662 / NCIMB 1420 / SS-2) TaxID=1122177 RepID=A0A2D0NBN0_FLAN2|nr:carbon-nitrogen hydrolase family protein [Flavilitoribacter nigricans]PHN05904.1 nitrilase [Flavilitoribacter nigricans DSM 23189 = NBRC 102662]
MKVAVVQAAGILFDLTSGLQKMEKLVAEAANAGARLILFPEAFLGGYPRGLSFGTVVGSRSPGGRDQWYDYWQHSLEIPGPEIDQIGTWAARHQVYLVAGIIERDRSGSTLYCSVAYWGPDGGLLHRHRKLKPTAAERLIWGEGDGTDLQVLETPLGRMGGLICWENYMPMARMALYEQGVQLYLAPTADARETWQASMRHIACEGRCYVLACNQYVERSDYPEPYRAEIADLPEVLCRGGSVIVDPLGQVVAGPLWDEEGILYADLDLREVAKGKLDFDVVGHYARRDVFGR